jgi:hypothetical protein
VCAMCSHGMCAWLRRSEHIAESVEAINSRLVGHDSLGAGLPYGQPDSRDGPTKPPLYL